MNRALKIKRYIAKQYPHFSEAEDEWDYEEIEIAVFERILNYGFINGLKIPKAYLLKHHITDITKTFAISEAMLYKGYDFKIPKKMKLLIKHWEFTFWYNGIWIKNKTKT